MRDEFPKSAQRQIAARAGFGVAAHITAASPNGPRYDPALTSDKRKSVDNGIWLCQNHAKLIDNDVARFPVSLLQDWKNQAETEAFDIIGKPSGSEHRAFLNLICRSDVEMIQLGRGYRIHLIFGMENAGLGIARHLILEIHRNRLFEYNPLGLDGNYRHGLTPQHSPHEQNIQNYIFSGNSDVVLHPNRLLEVAKFTANVSGIEAIQKVSIEYELYCEGYSLKSQIEIGLEEIIRKGMSASF